MRCAEQLVDVQWQLFWQGETSPEGSAVLYEACSKLHAQSTLAVLQLELMKGTFVWKGSGKQAVKVAPGEPDLAAKLPKLLMHGCIC